MFAVQKIASSSPRLMNVVCQQVRKEHIIATKPRVRVSFPEKLGHGAIIVLTPMIIPAWVALHLQEYKQK